MSTHGQVLKSIMKTRENRQFGNFGGTKPQAEEVHPTASRYSYDDVFVDLPILRAPPKLPGEKSLVTTKNQALLIQTTIGFAINNPPKVFILVRPKA